MNYPPRVDVSRAISTVFSRHSMRRVEDWKQLF